MRVWEGELIENRTEYCIQLSDKTSFKVSCLEKKAIFYIAPWKYEQSFLLLTCPHQSSTAQNHKRKESNQEKSWVLTDLKVLIEQKACVFVEKEKQKQPLLFSRDLGQIEHMDIQASTVR